MPLPIEDYALIGDCHTAALVGRDGSIDWLCLPRFDSGACFAALLGKPAHGRWLIAPVAELRSTRRQYRDGTMILETEFETKRAPCASSTACRSRMNAGMSCTSSKACVDEWRCAWNSSLLSMSEYEVKRTCEKGERPATPARRS